MDQGTLDLAAAIATATLLAVILGLTLVPRDRVPFKPKGNDKLHHTIAWAALCFPIAAARPELTILMFPAAVLIGLLVELIQPSVGRSRESADVIADAIGAAAGCGLGALCNIILV